MSLGRSVSVLVSLVMVSRWASAEPRRPPGSAPPMEYAPPPPVMPPGPAPGATCNALLVVRRTQGATGCVIDERVTRAPGVLEFPCEGGAATANFGGSMFAGSVVNGVVNLALSTRFHFSDGCDWESAQRIQGSLNAAALTYSYVEAPLPGQARCANACQAFGAVTVQR